MRHLLDTHTLLWFTFGDPKLSATALTTITDPANHILVSPASYWEIAVKIRTGKLVLNVPFPVFIQRAIVQTGFTVLPVEPWHAAELTTLPLHHRDPFDRMLIAQSIVERIPIIGCDAKFPAYPVTLVW